MSPTIAERLGAALAGRYELERELGAGGMATVWLARDVRHDRQVAIKVLRPELTAVLGAERFLAEIRLTARLDHPHILTLIDSGEADGLLYYVLPYVRGESLRARLDREKQLPIEEAAALVRQVASALAYAHASGVIHRDIKPENILLHEGEAVVTDFGIALALREAGGARLTESGLSLGTPQYMSPEQATGDRDLDARSDVYSLAAVLYELLTGDPPHAGTTVQAVIAKLLAEKPTPLRTLRGTVPESLEAVVFKALAKVPADRYGGAAPFGDALALALAQADRTTPPPPPTRVRLALAATLGLGLLLGGAAGAWLVQQRLAADEAAPTRTGTKVTFTGDVVDFALAPDAQRLVLGRLACGEAGHCETAVEVRDVRGGTSLPLARFLATYDLRWTSDGRYVIVSGADSAGRFGTFRVAALGGPVTYLGVYVAAEPVGRTDSLLAGNPGPNGTLLGVLVPGESQLRDTTLLRDVAEWAMAPDTRHVLLVVRRRDAVLLRLVDRRWRTTDSLAVPGYYSHPRWSPDGTRVVWLGNSDAGLTVTGVAVDGATGTFRGIPTPITGSFDMPQSFTGRRLDVASDGSIAYVSGLTPRVLHLLERPRAGVVPTITGRLATQTGRLRAFMSPDGGTVVFSRLVAGADGLGEHLVALDVRSGQEREVSPVLSGFLDAAWTPDGRAVIYGWYEPGVGTHFERWEAGSGRRSASSVYAGRALQLFWAMPDGSLLTISANGQSAERVDVATGKPTRTFALPDDQVLVVLGLSPDGRRAATQAWSATGDSLVIGSLDLASGAWREHARLYAEGTGTMRWLADGTVEFTVTSSVSTSQLFRLAPDRGTVVRLGELPVPFASYNLSLNGRYMAAVERRVVSDVFLVRPSK